MKICLVNWSVLVMVLVLLACPSCKKANKTTPNEVAPVEKKAVETPAPGENKAPPVPPKKESVKKGPGEPKDSDPKVKPEEQAELLAGKGVKNVRFKGLDKALDVLIGMDVMKLADPMGVELGEGGGKVVDGTFSYEGHELTYAKGKVSKMVLILTKIPGGLRDGKVVVPHRAGMASIKTLIDSCGELKKAGEVSTLTCHGGKTVVTHDAKNGVRVTIGK